MLIQLLTILAFAALFAGFVLFRPLEGRGGCHGCDAADGERDCTLGCAAARSTTSARKGPS